jgi:hypothetical protein
MKTAMELGIEVAVFNAMPSLIQLGDWDTIEQDAMPLIEAAGGAEISRACFEAQQDPAKKPQLERVMASAESGIFSGRNAYCAAVAGRYDLAFKWTREELSEDPANIGRYWTPDPVRQAIRSRDEFKDILKEMKLVQLYQERGWPDRCRPVGEDFVCE